MTNEEIVFKERCRLMKEGIIKGTGRVMKIKDDEGKEIELEEPESLYTYAAWKKLGFQVKKGQKAVAKFPIWKHVIKKAKKENEDDKKKLFVKTASFFTREQVDVIEEEEK